MIKKTIEMYFYIILTLWPPNIVLNLLFH